MRRYSLWGLCAVLATIALAPLHYLIDTTTRFLAIALPPVGKEVALLVGAITASVAVVASPVAALRAFWHRLVARTEEAVPLAA